MKLLQTDVVMMMIIELMSNKGTVVISYKLCGFSRMPILSKLIMFEQFLGSQSCIYFSTLKFLSKPKNSILISLPSRGSF